MPRASTKKKATRKKAKSSSGKKAAKKAKPKARTRTGSGSGSSRDTGGGREASASETAGEESRTGKLLIVDDEDSIREILSDRLDAEGHECRRAASAKEARRAIEKSVPDLVLCDIKMPGGSGTELLEWIVENEPETVTLMVTAVGELDTAVECLTRGAFDYIPKPFNLDQVAMAVEKGLEHRRLRRENRAYRESLEQKVQEQTATIEELLRDAAKTRITDSLIQVAEVLTTMKDLELTLERVLEAVVRLVSAERGAVFLYQERTGFQLEANHKVGNRGIQELTRFVEEILEEGEAREPFYTADPQGEVKLAGNAYVKRNKLSSLACVPLCVGDQLLGALYVDAREEEFDLELYDEEFFRVFGNLAAVAIQNSQAHRGLRAEVQVLREEQGGPHRYEDIVGESDAMQQVFQLVDKLSQTDTTVLILGESGTGKEMVARLIHSQGPRSDEPFIAVNCAAMPSELIEAELFGIESGTATGVEGRLGKFEAAQGGTLFLDEIGDLPALAQAKILRALQEKTIERVGSHRPLEVDVRILAATNVDLEQAVREGRFREDLYYRLNVLPIFIPPLRERVEDIPLLVEHYVRQFCADMKRPVLKISEESMASFTEPSWRGNVRELRNAVERAVILSDDEWLKPYRAAETLTGGQGMGSLSSKDLLTAFENKLTEQDVMISYAHLAHQRLRRLDRTAEFLGISFKTLKRRLEEEPPI